MLVVILYFLYHNTLPAYFTDEMQGGRQQQLTNPQHPLTEKETPKLADFLLYPHGKRAVSAPQTARYTPLNMPTLRVSRALEGHSMEIPLRESGLGFMELLIIAPQLTNLTRTERYNRRTKVVNRCILHFVSE